MEEKSLKILFLSSYPPRKCGIATFTQDLVTSLRQLPLVTIGIVALGDGSCGYDNEVLFSIERHEEKDYQEAAKRINESGYDLLIIEHEYGLFGKEDGKEVLTLAKEIHLPIVTTFHTILSHPNERQKDILSSLCNLSDAVVTMAGNSRDMLVSTYDADVTKIHVIPHGVPSFEGYQNRDALKAEADLEGRIIISTFGLLSSGKGLEYGIEALENVVKTHPKVIYLIAGQTHPVVREREGELYRHKLQYLVSSHGLENHVRFINHYFSQEDIVKLLLMSDIYLTPYLGKEQAVSGTLAYAAGCGKAIVSTPYPYAKELLDEGRGCLADFADVSSLSKQLSFLLDNPDELHRMERKMKVYGSAMVWSSVACRYAELCKSIVEAGVKA